MVGRRIYRIGSMFNVLDYLIPFIGFVTIDINDSGEPMFEGSSYFEADFFCFEWLGFGCTLWASEPRLKDTKPGD